MRTILNLLLAVTLIAPHGLAYGSSHEELFGEEGPASPKKSRTHKGINNADEDKKDEVVEKDAPKRIKKKTSKPKLAAQRKGLLERKITDPDLIDEDEDIPGTADDMARCGKKTGAIAQWVGKVIVDICLVATPVLSIIGASYTFDTSETQLLSKVVAGVSIAGFVGNKIIQFGADMQAQNTAILKDLIVKDHQRSNRIVELLKQQNQVKGDIESQ